MLGAPYQADGIWRYPRASYDSDETGLAVVATGHGPYATDGVAWDPTALMGAHPTLQLPCVVEVTNLETGLRLSLRLDDRGPPEPSRLLAVTPRAAALLGPGSEPGVLRVRVRVEEGPSRRLTERLGDPDAPPLPLSAAPAGAVRSEALAPPPGVVGRPPPPEQARPAPRVAVDEPAVPARLPEVVTRVPVAATELWIDAGGVGQRRYAELLRARLGGLGAVVTRDPRAAPEVAWRVRIGPLASVATADATLDRVLRAGVVDARIIVE